MTNTYELAKKCEKCDEPIPDTYGNLLCDSHYAEVTNLPPVSEPVTETEKPDFGIKDPNYEENPEAEDKEQVAANIGLFQNSGKLLYHLTRSMYEWINKYNMTKITEHPQYPKFIWKPQIVDVGCGSGVGSNVLSQEADFVWGIDKNAKSIQFAKEAFTRLKNGIYYSSQVTFDVVDMVQDTRDFMKFDEVVAIEIIEHVYDTHKFLQTLIKRFTKRDKHGNPHIPDATEFFISTPNRNSPTIRKDRPYNKYHVREWTGEEFVELLKRYFEVVELRNWKGELVEVSTEDTPVLAVCKYPKI